MSIKRCLIMCYLLAKKFKEPGSVTTKTRRGTELADFSSQLQKKLGKEVHLITVTRPSAYGEYAPFTFVKDYDEFEKAAFKMK